MLYNIVYKNGQKGTFLFSEFFGKQCFLLAEERKLNKMKKIISLVLALIMVLGMAVPAVAWSVQSIKVTGTYSGGKLDSITASIDWSLGDANCRLVLMEKCLTSPLTEGGSGDYGDFTNMGNYRTSFTSITDIANDSSLGVISYTDEKELEYGSKANKLKMNIADGDLDNAGVYYIYLWTRVNTYIYPDNLVAAIQVDSNGNVTYSPVLEGKRNTYDEAAFKAVEEEKYTFEYAYDCQRSIAYPKKSDKVTLSGLGNPYISSSTQASSPAGDWTVTKIGLWGDVKSSYPGAKELMEDIADGYGADVDELALYELKEGEDTICHGVIAAYSVNSADDSIVALFVGDTGAGSGGTGYALSNGQLSGNKEIEIDTDATDEDPMDVPTVTTYTVTYVADGVEIKNETVNEGEKATKYTDASDIPEKEGYTQTAPYWDYDESAITEDTTINAVYTINTYTVTYVAEGVEIKTETVEHGAKATKYTDASDIPEKEGYTQTAPVWDYDESAITKDTTIEAKYTINEYLVNYIAFGRIVDEQNVKHGEDAVAPEVPLIVLWNHDGKNITEDTDIYGYSIFGNGRPAGSEEVEEDGEQNPSTGAPVFAPAVIVLSAVASFLGKRK